MNNEENKKKNTNHLMPCDVIGGLSDEAQSKDTRLY